MDGRIVTLLLAEILPAVLIGVTIYEFASNPLSLMALIAVMVIGGCYLLTYADTF